MWGPHGVVGRCLWVVVRPLDVVLRRPMPTVESDARVAAIHRIITELYETSRCATRAAAADLEEFAVPVLGRQPQCESKGRCYVAGDLAISRDRRAGFDVLRCRDLCWGIRYVRKVRSLEIL